MNLKASLPKVAPIEATEAMERRIMGTPAAEAPVELPIDQALRKDVRTSIQEPAAQQPPVAARSVRREGTILLNAKIPVSLHIRLKRTAQYNDISMTDILLRGIEAELASGRYLAPPGTWGTDEREPG
jgi:hypothetical protein